MAWHAHPDRGGEELAFIRLCAAYKQVLKEVERTRISGARVPPRVPRKNRHSHPRGTAERIGRPPTMHPAGNERAAKPPEASWEPDLILLDEEPRNTRPPIPPDPNWDPDVVLLDDSHGDGRARAQPDPAAAAEPYRSWLRRVASRSRRRESVWQSGWVRTIGLTVFLALIAANLWLCWVAFTYDPEKEARRAERLLMESQLEANDRARDADGAARTSAERSRGRSAVPRPNPGL